MVSYPWYEIVSGSSLQQGDIIYSCPLLKLPENFNSGSEETYETEVVEYDVIVMSQSCDLEHNKISIVLVCPIYELKKFIENNPDYKNPKRIEQIRKGYLPGYHLLNKCELQNYETDYFIVDFRNVYGIHINNIREIIKNLDNRIRLLPPYREHLSQAFARFFMRVGLPVDIPPFK